MKNHPGAIILDINRKRSSMDWYNGEPLESLIFKPAPFTEGEITYNFSKKSFRNLQGDKFWDSITYVTRPGTSSSSLPHRKHRLGIYPHLLIQGSRDCGMVVSETK